MEDITLAQPSEMSPDVSLNGTGYRDLMEIYSIHIPEVGDVDKYLTPLWYIIGFPGNIFAFLVWVQPKMRHSSGVYLAALATADFIFLVLQLVYELQNTWNKNTIMYPVSCQLFPVLFLASQYMSPLLVLGFTVERYISICHPFKRETLCTVARAVKVVVSLSVFSLCLNMIQAYFWVYENGDCGPRETILRGDSLSLWSVWSWITELLVFGVVPLCILSLNLLVIVEARKLKRAEEKLLCLKQRGHKSNSGASATTFMLLAVSFYLIFTTLPVTILYVLHVQFGDRSVDMTMSDELINNDVVWQRHLAYYTINVVVREIGMSHYACNIFIYLATGQMFRNELRRLVCSTFCRNYNDRISNSELEELRATYSRKPGSSNGSAAHV